MDEKETIKHHGRSKATEIILVINYIVLASCKNIAPNSYIIFLYFFTLAYIFFYTTNRNTVL